MPGTFVLTPKFNKNECDSIPRSRTCDTIPSMELQHFRFVIYLPDFDELLTLHCNSVHSLEKS